MVGIGDDRISLLPDDLLVKILVSCPTKDAVATAVLSKRWRNVWTMLPRLVYVDSEYKQGVGKKESVWWFLDQSLKLHNAPVLHTLIIGLGPKCPVDVDVGEMIAIAVHRNVCKLLLKITWLSRPTSLPESLYIGNKLGLLAISTKIIVDVPSSVCLPLLKTLYLHYVSYKNEDSLVRLLSGCHILENLSVARHSQDNLKNIIVKVPTLKTFFYTDRALADGNVQNMVGYMVIDCASLTKLFIRDDTRKSLLIKSRPRLVKASIILSTDPDDEFMRSLSSVMYLNFALNAKFVACCNAMKFAHLIQSIIICPFGFDWLEPFMCFLHNSPKLKALQIYQNWIGEDLPLSFSGPSSVPECLSKHLEIFEWKEYRGRNVEKEVIRYILANSKCLKRVGISIGVTEDEGNRKEMMTELESMSRVSTSSQLLFSTQLNFEASITEEYKS